MKKIEPKHIAAVLYESTKDAKESEIPAIMKDIVLLIVKHRLIGKEQEIIREFASIYNDANGIEEVTITRAERSDAQAGFAEALTELLDAKGVSITEKVDERLLAGMKIETGNGLRIDATLAGRISQLRETLKR